MTKELQQGVQAEGQECWIKVKVARFWPERAVVVVELPGVAMLTLPDDQIQMAQVDPLRIPMIRSECWRELPDACRQPQGHGG